MLRHLRVLGCGLLFLLTLGSTQAEAQAVHFRFNGGHWSHYHHSGWNRYWGGPSIGFYYAPTPVYVVPGYSQPSYYTGSSFWYSNPSFGLNVNIGGGGGWHGNNGGHGGWHGNNGNRGQGHYSGGGRGTAYSGSGGHGGGGRAMATSHGGGARSGGGSHGGGSHGDGHDRR